LIGQLNFRRTILASKLFAYLMVSAVLLYLFNNYLVYWVDLPGTYRLLIHYGLTSESAQALNAEQLTQAWWQVLGYLVVFASVIFYALRRASMDLYLEAEHFSRFAAYLVRSAFWAVMLIGLADMLISFLRVEQMLQFFIGDELITELGRPSYRGTYVHYPLLVISFVAAFFFRRLNFAWLALMVVLAEFAIVITRFVFSYEQAFMGDLVRFWYAALFLFASAYTLLHEGHVRVDVLYAGFSRARKAWSNIVGCIALGIPLCWVILMQGMGGKGNSINSPLLSFEISQSGYGMYVKYLMAGFMVVFAVTMIVQFVSYLLHNVAELIDPRPLEDDEDEHHEAAVTGH
jgi:TRAP-type mannitol/chloroaromatic compound transport system permease small subunit